MHDVNCSLPVHCVYALNLAPFLIRISIYHIKLQLFAMSLPISFLLIYLKKTNKLGIAKTKTLGVKRC